MAKAIFSNSQVYAPSSSLPLLPTCILPYHFLILYISTFKPPYYFGRNRGATKQRLTMNPSFKSVLSAITSLTPPPSSDSPYSLSALVDSPRSGEKHTNFYPANSCEYDTDSPSCYDSDSLLDFTTSSYLESTDTLDTSVSWYCRGDEDEDEDEGDDKYSRHGDGDNEIRFALRSGERTPLSPNVLDSPAPLLDSKVFILRPVRLLNDDFDFTCAGPEEVSSLSVRVRYQLHHHHHHHHHHHLHHSRRHNNNNNTNTKHAPRPHPRKPEHQQQQQPNILPSDSDSHVLSPQSNFSKLQSFTIDYSKRRWSAPSASSPHSSMLTRATTMTGTLLDTPLSLSLADYSESSSISQDQDLSTTDSSSGDSLIDNISQPPREKNHPCRKPGGGLQMYTITDAQNQILTSRLKALQISSSATQPIQRKISSSSINGMDTPTPRTWPHRRRKSEAFYRLRSDGSNIGFKDAVSNYRQDDVDAPIKKRSQTMQLFCASNKWGNQPPNGYI